MLPGFRFLFAAVVLSMSVLVFGLGAAALLRSAHEKFASLPSRRAPAEQVFTQQNEPSTPTLALLRFDPPAGEPAVASPAPETAPAETEKLAALPEEPILSDAAKPLSDATKPTALPAETPASPATAVENSTPPDTTSDVKSAVVAEAPSAAPVATPPAIETPSIEGNIAATKIATLGGPAVVIPEQTASNEAEAKPDRAVKKRNAQRARERRRLAARRARLAARQAALAAQQANPFGQPAVQRTQ